MRKLSGFILVLVFVVACDEQKPSDILPQDKMREVMWDMLKAGEFLEGYVFNYDTSINKAGETAAWYEQVYRMHNITKSQFEKSYAYYREHPALMKVMLDSLGKRNMPGAAPDTVDKAIETVAEDSIKPAGPATDSILKDSGFKRMNYPEISEPLIPGKRRNLLVDSIKRSRLLQRKKLRQQ